VTGCRPGFVTLDHRTVTFRNAPGRRLNRVIFMNSALNTEVGSLNRIECRALGSIQFYSEVE